MVDHGLRPQSWSSLVGTGLSGSEQLWKLLIIACSFIHFVFTASFIRHSFIHSVFLSLQHHLPIHSFTLSLLYHPSIHSFTSSVFTASFLA